MVLEATKMNSMRLPIVGGFHKQFMYNVWLSADCQCGTCYSFGEVKEFFS